MSKLGRFSVTHQGYMAGLNGEDPDENLQRLEEYEAGWLAGYEDREKGVQSSSFLGPVEEFPIKRNAEVVIPKGTQIQHRGKVTVAKRDYKVKLHDIYPGRPAYVEWNDNRTVIRPTYARVLWAGAGGYWSEASLSDILKGT